MNGMGDIRVDEHALLRALGPQVDALAPGALHRAAAAVAADDVAALIADEDARFEIDPRLSGEEREDHARMQLGLERVLREGGYGAYSTHFDAIAEDGRFARLPLAAASSLMAEGYGYAAEGDALTAALMSAAQHAARRRRSSPRCTRWTSPRDSILMSHMGEGNWRLAREDRPVRLIKRPLGIGGLDDPPTFLFQYRPGPATLATLVVARRRAVPAASSARERSSTPTSCPRSRCPTGSSGPTRACATCMDAWLRLGGPAPPGAQPGAPGATRGGCSASWPASSSRRSDRVAAVHSSPEGGAAMRRICPQGSAGSR